MGCAKSKNDGDSETSSNPSQTPSDMHYGASGRTSKGQETTGAQHEASSAGCGGTLVENGCISGGEIVELRRRLSVAFIEDGASSAGCANVTATGIPQIDMDSPDYEEKRSAVIQLDKQELLVLIKELQDCESIPQSPELSTPESPTPLMMSTRRRSSSDYGSGREPGTRRFSISSVTDEERHLKESFGAKAIMVAGDRFDDRNLGYACKKGLKPEAPNQDSFLIVKVEELYSIYGVFDGHGKKGHDISNYVKDQLPKVLVAQDCIEADPIKALQNAFSQTQMLIEQATAIGLIDARSSGSTCSVIIHDHGSNVLFVAHVGDSRCVLGIGPSSSWQAGSDEWRARDLTEDHKPSDPAERKRIEEAGGRVVFDGFHNYRVYAKGKRYPGLNMSRAMGDLLGHHHAGISASPVVEGINIKDGGHVAGDTKEKEKETIAAPQSSPQRSSEDPLADDEERIPVLPEDVDMLELGNVGCASHQASVSSHNLSSADRFVLLCSDGIWEFISSQEAVDIVSRYPPERAMEAAETLAATAWQRWMQFSQGTVVDDITVLLVHFLDINTSSVIV